MNGKISHKYTHVINFRKAAPMFSPQQSFRFLYLGTLKNPNVFTSNCKLKDALHPNFDVCQTFPKPPGMFATLRRSIIGHAHAYTDSGEKIFNICCKM